MCSGLLIPSGCRRLQKDALQVEESANGGLLALALRLVLFPRFFHEFWCMFLCCKCVKSVHESVCKCVSSEAIISLTLLSSLSKSE